MYHSKELFLLIFFKNYVNFLNNDYPSISSPRRRASSEACSALTFKPFNSNDPVSPTRIPRISESTNESPFNRVRLNSAIVRSQSENSTRSNRHSSNPTLRIVPPAKRTPRNYPSVKLANSILQRSKTTCRHVPSERLAPTSLHSTNSTRWKLHPDKSAFDRSQFRNVTSVK